MLAPLSLLTEVAPCRVSFATLPNSLSFGAVYSFFEIAFLGMVTIFSSLIADASQLIRASILRGRKVRVGPITWPN